MRQKKRKMKRIRAGKYKLVFNPDTVHDVCGPMLSLLMQRPAIVPQNRSFRYTNGKGFSYPPTIGTFQV